jgi:hypothetical protein
MQKAQKTEDIKVNDFLKISNVDEKGKKIDNNQDLVLD